MMRLKSLRATTSVVALVGLLGSQMAYALDSDPSSSVDSGKVTYEMYNVHSFSGKLIEGKIEGSHPWKEGDLLPKGSGGLYDQPPLKIRGYANPQDEGILRDG